MVSDRSEKLGVAGAGCMRGADHETLSCKRSGSSAMKRWGFDDGAVVCSGRGVYEPGRGMVGEGKCRKFKCSSCRREERCCLPLAAWPRDEGGAMGPLVEGNSARFTRHSKKFTQSRQDLTLLAEFSGTKI